MTSEATQGLPGPENKTLSIFLVSVLGLFLELMLIRWIGTEIRIFAYLQNTVLIVCFLGFGLGCFTCRSRIKIWHSLAALAALVALLAAPPSRAILRKITDLLSVLSDLLIWQHATSEGTITSILRVSLGLLLTLGLMVLLCEVFVPWGRLLGRLIADHPRTIWAYSVNVAGSLIGIWLFVALCAFSAPPLVWILAAAVLLSCYLLSRREWRLNASLLAVLVVAGAFVGREPHSEETIWSPYQKLMVVDNSHVPTPFAEKYIFVNNTGYQAMMDLAPESVLKNPRIPADMRGLSQYDIPLRFKPNPKRVLIVGAGSGNDVAGALRGGAEQVVAVEIDPVIIDMGRRGHPERPYDSDRVQVVTDDARSYLAGCSESSEQRFDLIIFGLLDSHTTSAMTNARLDHYVYTRESLSRARDLLAEGGVMVLSFEAVKPYISDRMGRCLQEVFGREPLAFRMPSGGWGWGGALFVVGDSTAIDGALAADAPLADKIAAWQAASPIEIEGKTLVATDDWPYIYLEAPSIPTLYFLLAGLLGALVLYCKRRVRPAPLFGRWQASHWKFFFLGAAFLLLEVQNISKASVALGSTWTVSAVIISGILTMILLANLIVARWPNVSQNAAAACLIGCCLAMYFIDLSSFAFLPYGVKVLLIGGLTALPMLFSGILFAQSFSAAGHKDSALGANLMGSIAGGILQSLTFLIGVKALLLVVAALYLAAILIDRPKSRKRDDDKRDDKRDDKSDDNESSSEAWERQEDERELAAV